MVGAHPMYLLKTGQGDYLIEKMSEGITMVAEELFPKPLIVRLSDFRTNEFRGLKGGEEVEPIEANPMIGWRGVSRYISPEYREGFRLECRAIKKVRDEYGLTNVYVMLPFVRTTWELKEAKQIMKEEGLVQGPNFKIWIMAEVPSVVFAAEEFAQLVDGFSIGSNDLTQLILGIDRDSGILNSMGYFDERDIAVKTAIKTLIDAAHKYGKTVSICGQGPSLYPDLTEFLVNAGIDSVSVNPDTVAFTRRLVASVEQKLILNRVRDLK
jgi:pyruvate,water dikinase